MRLFKKWSMWALTLAMLIVSVPTNVHAAATLYERADYEGHYNLVMASAVAPYLITAQPSSALILEQQTAITAEQLSPNYDRAVIDLPRLQATYYYKVTSVNGMPVLESEDTYGIRVNRTLYPSLSWTSKIPANTVVTLCICDEATNTIQKTLTLTFLEELEGDTNISDVSESLIYDIMNSNSSKYNGSTTYYPAELHKDSIITSSFAVGFSDNFNGFRTNLMNNVSIAEAVSFNNAIKFTNYITSTKTTNIKEAVLPYISGSNNGRPELFSAFIVSSTVVHDSNRGTVTTYISGNIGQAIVNGYVGYYCICTGTDFELYVVEDNQYTGNLQNISETSPLVTLPNNQAYNIEEKLGKYGFNEWAEANKSLFDISDYPTVKYTGSSDNTLNVYQAAMAYGGVLPNVATIKAQKPVETYRVVTWYTRPTETLLKKCEEVEVNVGSSISTLKPPSEYISLYTFDTWYSDQACTKKADLSQISANAKANDVINLYGKFNYTGGNYSVTFFNDYDNSSTTQEYEVRNQPVLPEAPTRPGYMFRNWQIVYTTSSSSGTVYDPATFNPQTSIKYLFKTFWDIEGVITSVTSNKKEYYVGDYVDKDALVVTAQTDNSGTVRTLNSDEFTVSPDKIENTGTKQYVVTYNATGATATVNLTGKAVTPLSLTAKYTGGEMNVGDVINKGSIVCTIQYNNNTTEEVTDFSITPTTITNAGGNTIRVFHGALSTSVSITGKKATSTGTGTGGNSGGGSSNKPGTGGGTGTGGSTGGGSSSKPGTGTGTSTQKQKVLQSITASYKGAQPYAGDTLKANDISVVATYTDGSTVNLNSTAFQYSPSLIRNEGSNTIIVSYGGKQTTFVINALPASSNPNSAPVITGVDSEGNAVTKRPEEVQVSESTAVSNKKPLSTLGNPLTGAGVSSGDKGTSVGYLNGNNILTNRLYGGTTAIENDLDILGEIEAASDKASGITVELYNGASNNDITAEMLSKLKEKELMMTVLMLNPDTSKPVAKWVILGDLLTDTSKSFSPNVSFEVTDKGSDILTYMTVLDTEYPDNTQLFVYPATSTYASGELIRMYSCGLDKSNAHLEKSFTWLDGDNEVIFDTANSTRYCLTNALAAYPEGSSLTENIDLPSMGNSTVVDQGDAEEPSTEEEFDWSEESTEEDWDWAEEPEEEKKSSFPWIIIPIAIVAVLAVGGGIIVLSKLRKTRSSSDEEDLEYDEMSDAMYEEEEDEFFDPNVTESDYVEEVIDAPKGIDLE